MNTSHVVALNTTGKLAADLNQPIHRIKWVLSTRGIKHVAVAGNVRLFDENAKARLRYELNLIDARKQR